MSQNIISTFSTRLTRKGLIIIAIPVLFSLAFIVSLKVLLDEAQAQLDKETKSKEIIANASGLGQAVVSAIFEGYDSSFTPGGQRSAGMQESKKLIQERFDALASAVPPGGRQAELAERIGKALNIAITLVEQNGTNLNLRRQPSMVGLSQLLQTRRQLHLVANSMQQDAAELIQIERQSQSAQPMSYKSFKQVIDVVLYGGIAIDIVLAIGLMAFFSKDISDRLNVLMDNSNRLVEEKELNPIVSGKDEITRLDTIFHEMASKLAAARASERLLSDRMRSIIETIPLGLVVADDSGEIVSLSPGAERMFEKDSGGLAGKPVQELFEAHQSNKDGVANLLEKTGATAKRFEGKRNDGSEFPCEILCTEYNTTDMNGKLLVVTDITERQEVERLKQSFIAMVSHELRSPLTSIQFCLRMLLKNFFGPLNQDGAEKVKMAEENTVRLMKLVNEILDVERLESGKIAVSLERIDLSYIFQLSVGSVQSLAESAGIKIDATDTETVLDADRDRLVQVIVNFLSNAIKFSAHGSTVELSSNTSNGSVRVDVKDSGRGIPSDQLHLVFERFHQVARSDASEKGGTGLGLAICKAIIEAHDGEIGVESTEGAGSTFWFRVPLSAKPTS